ncbi:SET domain-containing protein [Brevibacillus reuszeri]|uniref:SET domain-containing protein n=1 Tax=Brevibacillus reuszeri TaxID=54915 RepID=UPI000CCBFAF4|nr:SET domain-containing protein [Brevibacillus reuszeri]
MLRIEYIEGKGRGVIAAKNIKQGTIIERSPVIVIPQNEIPYIFNTVLINYSFSWGSNETAIALGCGSLYNHSYHPNATYYTRIDDMCIVFQALENIQAGQEITIDYGWHPNAFVWE